MSSPSVSAPAARAWRAVARALLVAGLAAGCGKDPPGRILYPGPPVTAGTPQEVVARFAAAWTARDTVAVPALLDSAYVGTSTESTPTTLIVISLTRQNEIRIVRNLARDATVLRVAVDLQPNSITRASSASDPAGWATVEIHGGSVELGTTTATYVGHWDTMNFKLRPTAPAPDSPTDTTWTIVRWNETRSH